MRDDVLAAVSDAVVAIDADQRLTYINPAAERQYGVAGAAMLGHRLSELFETRWLSSDDERAATTAFRERGEWRGECIHLARDGRALNVESNVTLLRDTGGGFAGMRAVIRDITERRHAEQALSAEVRERSLAETRLRELGSQLEKRVAERVAELAGTARLLAEQNVEIQRAHRSLEAKAADLARRSAHKSEFLASLSHELRSPLNSILVLSRQLAANGVGNLSDEQTEFARHIHASGVDLLRLIEEILDLSKIESGTVSVHVHDVSLARVREHVERHVRHLADAKSLPFRVRFAPDLPDAIATDAQRLRQILENLLANAVKFTARGHVEWRVDLATRGWTRGHPTLSRASSVLAFTIEDTGIGVAREEQRSIFDAFHQVDAQLSRRVGGAGLGLAISQKLAALLGGELRVSSAFGHGSTFTLYLPVQFVAPAPYAAARLTAEQERTTHMLGPAAGPRDELETARVSAHAPARGRAAPATLRPPGSGAQGVDESLRGRKALVVDDDARNVFALGALLELHELRVVSATNGRDAIEIVRNGADLDIVLLDMIMPDVDGFEVLRAIRSSERTSHLPVFAVTGMAMRGDRERCLVAGADDYVAKPVRPEDLLALMRTWLAR